MYVCDHDRWPGMKTTITNYIKVCALCQSRKNNPMNPKPPIFPITSDTYTLPFTFIALDFIIKLQQLNHYDTIHTITDTFSKPLIFIACNETVDAEQMASLIATYILPHYGLPAQVISDQDPCFTSTFTKELCKLLQIEQNISTAYHPKQMTSWNTSTSGQNNTFTSLATSIRMTEHTGYHWHNMHITHGQIQQQRKPCSNSS